MLTALFGVGRIERVRQSVMFRVAPNINRTTKSGLGSFRSNLLFRTRASHADRPEGKKYDSQIPRFYVDERFKRDCVPMVTLMGTEANHALKVLRMKEGDPVELCDGHGGIVRGVIGHTRKNGAKIECSSLPTFEAWMGPRLQLVVACGTLKGGRGDWLVEKATELGAFAFIPLITQRANVMGSKSKQGEEMSGRESRWRRLAISAMKQSKRSHGLDVHSPMNIMELAELIKNSTVSLLAAAGAPHVLSRLGECESRIGQDSDMLLIVGPEGDFTSEEIDVLSGAGALLTGLGPNRLRVETAAVSLLAVSSMYYTKD